MADERLRAMIRDVEADHLELEHQFRQLEEALAVGEQSGWDPRDVAEIARLLLVLQEQLLAHFAQEEEGGYLEEALAVAPRFGSQAGILLRQHPVLARAVEELIEDVEDCRKKPECWAGVRWRVVELTKRLKAHEAAENRILEEAFNTDMGFGD